MSVHTHSRLDIMTDPTKKRLLYAPQAFDYSYTICGCIRLSAASLVSLLGVVALVSMALASTAFGVAISNRGSTAYSTMNHLVLTYRTGPYETAGASLIDGMEAGMEVYSLITSSRKKKLRVKLLECESGYNTSTGVECMYENAGQFVSMSTLSTSLAAAAETTAPHLGVNSLLSGYGNEALAAAPANFTFTTGPTYTDAAKKWMSSLQSGMTIGYIGHGPGVGGGFSLYGLAPIAQLQTYNGTLITRSCAHPCTDATIIDGIISEFVAQGVSEIYCHPWGGMVAAVLRSAKGAGVLDKMTTIWWGQSHDIGKEFLTAKAMSLTGTLPTIAVPSGRSQSVFFQGVREAIVVTEAVRNYISTHERNYEYSYTSNKVPYFVDMPLVMTPHTMNTALQHLNINQGRLQAMGLANFMEPCVLTPTDHSTGCSGLKYVRWTETGWENII